MPNSIRDRVKAFRRVRASELKPCPLNWRTHPEAQKKALRGLLEEVGFASALLARELPDGSLALIDGHLRAETTPDMEVPVLVLDVTEAEALKILATHDPLAAMAGVDNARLDELLRTVQTGSTDVADMLADLAESAGIVPAEATEWPELSDGKQRTVTIRFTDADEPAIKAFVGQRDNRPLDPQKTGAKILERIKKQAAS